LVDERDKSSVRASTIQNDLDNILSKYSALKQAYKDFKAPSGLAALLMIFGGTMVSVAGAISGADWKPFLLWGGMAVFGSAFLFAAQTYLRNSPDDY